VCYQLRKVVVTIHSSPQRMELLENACRLCSLEFVKPVLDVPTRWNSTFDMIHVAIRLRPALNSLFNSQTDLQRHAISPDEWALLGEVVDLFLIFKELTEKMSQNIPSVFWVIPLFNVLFDRVEDVADNAASAEPIRAAAIQTRHKLQEYYSKTNVTTMLCTLLDPRRKLLYFVKKRFPREEVDALKTL
jgi:hypothetical protein